MGQNFYTRVAECWERHDSLVCVGLDPESDKIPAGLSVIDFLKDIVRATAPHASTFKPQFAHFAALGLERELAELIAWIKKSYPQHLVILDAKRGDIASTASKYAEEAFRRYNADAVTLNPYLGTDSLEAFLKYAERGAIVLVRTSNPGARDFQNLDCGGESLFMRVAAKLQTLNHNQNMAFVVGATYPDEMKALRKMCPEIPFLVPGIGAQGGDLGAAMSAGLRSYGDGLFISSSRAILYASAGRDFAEAAATAAQELKRAIQKLRPKKY